jgi:hypothetical protein
MQKVEGSSPFIRLSETPAQTGVSSFREGRRRVRSPPADQLGGPICIESARRESPVPTRPSATGRQALRPGRSSPGGSCPLASPKACSLDMPPIAPPPLLVAHSESDSELTIGEDARRPRRERARNRWARLHLPDSESAVPVGPPPAGQVAGVRCGAAGQPITRWHSVRPR